MIKLADVSGLAAKPDLGQRRRLSQVAMVVLLPMLLMLALVGSKPATWARDRSNFHDRVSQFVAKQPLQTSQFVAWRLLQLDSPWAPYLEHQFEAGLPPELRRHQQRAASAGHCKEVLALDRAGLLARVPALAAELSRPLIRHQFETIIVPHHSWAYRRCRAINELLPLISTSQREGWPQAMMPPAAGPPRQNAMPPRTDALLSLGRAVAILEKLALCFHDRAAMRFLLAHHEPLLYFRFAGVNGYYLLYLSHKLGIGPPNFDALAATRRTGVSPVDVARIRGAFARMSAQEASQQLWYRREACSRPNRQLP